MGHERDHSISIVQLSRFFRARSQGPASDWQYRDLCQNMRHLFCGGSPCPSHSDLDGCQLAPLLTCSTSAKCIQSWFVLCLRYRWCWGAYSCLINHRQLQCPSVPSVTTAMLKISGLLTTRLRIFTSAQARMCQAFDSLWASCNVAAQFVRFTKYL